MCNPSPLIKLNEAAGRSHYQSPSRSAVLLTLACSRDSYIYDTHTDREIEREIEGVRVRGSVEEGDTYILCKLRAQEALGKFKSCRKCRRANAINKWFRLRLWTLTC